MVSRKDEKATVEIPRAANIPKTMEAWIGSDRVLTPDGDGRAHPSGPIPWIASGSGSGTAFLLKNDREDDDDDDDVWNMVGVFTIMALGVEEVNADAL